MRTGPDNTVGRGKGLALVLAALGAVLIVTAVTLYAGHGGGNAIAHQRASYAAPSHGERTQQPHPRTDRPAGGRSASQATAGHASGPGAPAGPQILQPGRPLRLTIGSLKISAPVVPITLASSTLTPPSDPQILGWWSGGARPGAARGTTLITGHTVHTGGGTFDHLDALARGDRLRIDTTSGPLAYRVTTVADYPKPWLAAHASRVFSQTVPGRLALVTCTDWTGTTYLSNTVVLATPIGG